jgi:hypothetical protein
VAFDPIGSTNLRRVREMRLERQTMTFFSPDKSLLSIPRPAIDGADAVLAKVGG